MSRKVESPPFNAPLFLLEIEAAIEAEQELISVPISTARDLGLAACLLQESPTAMPLSADIEALAQVVVDTIRAHEPWSNEAPHPTECFSIDGEIYPREIAVRVLSVFLARQMGGRALRPDVA